MPDVNMMLDAICSLFATHMDARGVWIEQDTDQRICSAVGMHIRKGQLTLASIVCFCALRISSEVKRLVLFAGDAAVCIVWRANQVFDLF